MLGISAPEGAQTCLIAIGSLVAPGLSPRLCLSRSYALVLLWIVTALDVSFDATGNKQYQQYKAYDRTAGSEQDSDECAATQHHAEDNQGG